MLTFYFDLTPPILIYILNYILQVTPCSSTPCMNNGLCKVEGHGYICKCLDSFTGPQCTGEFKDFQQNSNDNLKLDLNVF